jgi:hypothetical protein
MSRTYKDSPAGKRERSNKGAGRQRHISVRAVRRDPPDLRKLSRALIQLAVEQAGAEAGAVADRQQPAGQDEAAGPSEAPDA